MRAAQSDSAPKPSGVAAAGADAAATRPFHLWLRHLAQDRNVAVVETGRAMVGGA